MIETMTPRDDARTADATRPPSRRVAAAVGALAAILALLFVAPAALLYLGGALPIDFGRSVSGALLRPDDGQLLLLVLLALGWIGWGLTALSVLTEVASALRRAPTPRLPGLATQQRWAAALVAAVVLGIASGPSATAADAQAPGLRAAVAAVAGVTATGPSPSAPRAAPDEVSEPMQRVAQVPTVITQRHDTLWLLAEQHLGAGERYAEIVELNRGSAQPDGRSLGDDGRLYPGWSLVLPADARIDVPRPDRHAVESGESLWSIADDVLGDATRYTEIAELNHGDLQPGGGRLADPDLIRPGWVLEVPTPLDDAPVAISPDSSDVDDTGGLAAEPAGPTRAEGGALGATGQDPGTPPGAVPGSGLTPRPSVSDEPDSAMEGPVGVSSSPSGAAGPLAGVLPSERGGPDHAEVADIDPAPVAAPGHGSASPVSEASEEIGVSGAAAAHPDRAHVVPAIGSPIFMPAGGAVSALLLAGFVGALVRRRRQFQRLRRPGERMADPGADARAVEAVARGAGSGKSTATLERALIQLAATAWAAGIPVPAVSLVRVDQEGVTLELSGSGVPDAVAISPFLAVGERTWQLDPGLLDRDPPEHPRAFPALVSLGAVGESTVLVDLEALGTLAVVGPEPVLSEVMRGLTAELAFGTAAGHTARTLCLADTSIMGALEPGEIEVVDDPAIVAATIRQRLALGGARSDGDPWSSDPIQLVLTDRDPEVSVPPGCGVGVIVAAPILGAGATLSLEPDGRAELLPQGVVLQPQALARASSAAMSEALQAADLADGVPADGVIVVGAAPAPARPAGLPDQEVPTADQATPEQVVSDRMVSETPVPDHQVSDRMVAEQPAMAFAAPVARDVDHGAAVAHPPTADPPDLPADRLAGALGDSPEAAPHILLLGEVIVEGAHGRAEPSRIGRLGEAAAFLLLNPGARPSELQGALWPGRRSNPATCRQLISRTRTWLGRTPEGKPYLMDMAEADSRLRLRDEIGSDWSDFQRLAAAGLDDPQDTENLGAALALVRGRPFGPVAGRELPWADLALNDMLMLITDVAHALATRHLAAGRILPARAAALRGLRTECEAEVLREILARTA